MLKKAAFLCGYAGVAGALGALIRWIQLSRIVEDTGLLRRGDGWSVALVLWLLLAAAGLLFLVRNFRGSLMPELYNDALCSNNILYPISTALLMLLELIAAVILFVNADSYDSGTLRGLERILAVLAFVSAPCLLLVALGDKRESGKLLCAVHILPLLFFCFWLIVSYREHAADPSVWSFAIEILAICSAVLAWFFMAGYAFETPRPAYALFFSLLCVVFCLVSLADDRATAKQLIFLCTALMELLRSAVCISNFGEKE